VTVAEFFLKLATNPELQSQFQKDPKGFIRDSDDLSDEAKQLLTSGSLQEVRFEVRTDLSVEGEQAVTSVIWIHIPPWIHLDES
jgi:hypothetical protein